MAIAAAVEPPRLAGGEEQVVDAVAVEVAPPVVAVLVDADQIVFGVDVLRVAAEGTVGSRRRGQRDVREHVRDHLRVDAGHATQLERVVLVVEEAVETNVDVLAAGAAVPLAEPGAGVGAVHVERVRVEGRAGLLLVNPAVLEHEVAPGVVAGAKLAVAGNRVPVVVEHVLLDQGERRVDDLDAVAVGAVLLVVVDEVVVDAHRHVVLHRAGVVCKKAADRAELIRDADRGSAPAVDLVVVDLDVQRRFDGDAVRRRGYLTGDPRLRAGNPQPREADLAGAGPTVNQEEDVGRVAAIQILVQDAAHVEQRTGLAGCPPPNQLHTLGDVDELAAGQVQLQVVLDEDPRVLGGDRLDQQRHLVVGRQRDRRPSAGIGQQLHRRPRRREGAIRPAVRNPQRVGARGNRIDGAAAGASRRKVVHGHGQRAAAGGRLDVPGQRHQLARVDDRR